MKFSAGARRVYWLGLIALLTWFLSTRIQDARAGHATAADSLVFAVWIALLLAPLFSEVELLGVKLKQEVEKAKEDIKREIVSLKTEITSAIEVRTNVSPNFYLAPPADAQLPTLEAQIKRVLDRYDVPRAPQPLDERVYAEAAADGDVLFLMTTRRDLEVELRRIVRERQLSNTDRPVAGMQLARTLGQAEIVDHELLKAVREVYAVCSPAVHGEPVSPAKVDFVRDIAPSLIAALRAIH